MRNAFPLMKIRIKPCRFPTKEWKALGTFHAREERTVQSFAVGDEEMFAKYVKVNIKGRLLPLATTITHYYRPQTKFAKVRFLHVSVSHSVHTGGWYPSMPCSRSRGGVYPSMPCRFPGPHPRGSLRGLSHTRGGSPCPHPGGVSRPTPGGFSRPPLLTATAAGGTRATGMHSCFVLCCFMGT